MSDTRTVRISLYDWGYNLHSNIFDTEAEVAEIVGLLKAGTGVSRSYSTSGDGWSIHASTTLAANGVNGGRNETGWKRYLTLMRNAEKNGITVEVNMAASNAMTRDQFETFHTERI